MSTKLRIGIITIVKVGNYGAELQAFALQKKLSDLGYLSEIIDYIYYKNKDHIVTKNSKPFVKIGTIKRFKETLYPFISSLKLLKNKKYKKIRDEKFSKFHKRYTKFSNNAFNSIDELYNSKFDYDVFIVGSDQVWNPFTNTSLRPYFLTFAPANTKKISYASSFGVSKLPNEVKSVYHELLMNLDKISVREEQGVKIIKEICEKNVCLVLDPTLLLSPKEWSELSAKPSVKKPYLLLYVLTDSIYITKMAKKIAKKMNLNIVRICKDAVKEDRDSYIDNIIDAGPDEFIGLFMNAAFILTDSFHGTAFSINFEKQFYTIIPNKKLNNSRQQGLLKLMNLSKRLIVEGGKLPDENQYFINFNDASSQLKKYREKSIDYLSKTIDGC